MKIKNQAGITLIELLGALSILLILIILIGSAHLLGQRQFIKQTDAVDKQSEIREVVNQLTADLRSVNAEDILLEDNQLTVGPNIYLHSGTTLERNEQILSRVIDTLNFDLTEDGIEITIKTTRNKNGNRASIETAVYFRR